MKRYSTLLIIACWLVCLFVLSTVTLQLDSVETKNMAIQKSHATQDITAQVAM